MHRTTERLRQQHLSITASVRAPRGGDTNPDLTSAAAHEPSPPAQPGAGLVSAAAATGDPVRQRLDFTGTLAGGHRGREVRIEGAPTGRDHARGSQASRERGGASQGSGLEGAGARLPSPLLPRARSTDLGTRRAAGGAATSSLRASAAAGPAQSGLRSGSGLADVAAQGLASPTQRRLSELRSRGPRASSHDLSKPLSMASPTRRREARTAQHLQENLPSAQAAEASALNPNPNPSCPAEDPAVAPPAGSPARRRRLPPELVVPDEAAVGGGGGGAASGTRRALGDVTRSFNGPASPLVSTPVRVWILTSCYRRSDQAFNACCWFL